MRIETMHIDFIEDDFGAIVTGAPGDDLFALDADRIIELIKGYGAVVFAGYNASLDDFNRFAARFGTEFMTYKGGGYIRRRVDAVNDDTLLSVSYDHGREKQDTFGLPLHGEMYYVDNRPTLLWFHCVRPADADGETTICDAAKLYDALSDKWKRLIADKRLKYSRRYLDGEWQKVYQTEDADEAVAFCVQNGLKARFENDTRTLRTEYLHPAAITSRWGDHTAYINNILPVVWQENMGRETSIVRFEDDTRIPPELIDDVVAEQQKIMHDIPWKAGDFVVVDNTRTLHGRRAFEDTNREVYLRMVRNVPF